MRTRAFLLAPLMLAALASPAGAADRTPYNARHDVAVDRSVPAGARAAAHLAVTGSDRTRGVPTMALAPLPFEALPAAVTREPGAAARHSCAAGQRSMG